MANKITLEFLEETAIELGGTYTNENGLQEPFCRLEKLGCLWKHEKCFSGYYKGKKVVAFLNNTTINMYEQTQGKLGYPLKKFNNWYSKNDRIYKRDMNVVLVPNPNVGENSPMYIIYEVI